MKKHPGLICCLLLIANIALAQESVSGYSEIFSFNTEYSQNQLDVYGYSDNFELNTTIDGFNELTGTSSIFSLSTILDDFNEVSGSSGLFSLNTVFDGFYGETDLFIFNSVSAHIFGVITNSETGEPIENIIVETHRYQSRPTGEDGVFNLYVPFGLGYNISIESGRYEAAYIQDIDVPEEDPIQEIDINLIPVPVYYDVTTVHPDPNPFISSVVERGTLYRHYRVINTHNDAPIPMATIRVTGAGFSEDFYSDANGFVTISIPSSKIGEGEPGCAAAFQVVSVDSEQLPEPITFNSLVTHRRYSKYWDSGEYMKLGGNILGIDITVERESGGVTVLEVDESKDSLPQNIGIIRQARAGGGVGFKVKSPGIKGELGPVSGGVGAEAGVGISILGITEDEYLFPLVSETIYEKVSKYILIADGNFGSLDNTLIRLLAVCENWFTNETSLLDAFVSDAVGLEVAASAKAEANAGIDVAQAVELDASANIGVDGNVGFKAKHYYAPPGFEYSFSASGGLKTSAEAGISMEFAFNDQSVKEFDERFELWNTNLRRGLEFAVRRSSITGPVEQYRLTLTKRDNNRNVEEKISYFISGEDAISDIENLNSDISQLTNTHNTGSNLVVKNNTFQSILQSVFNLLYDLQTTEDGSANISYNVERTNITSSSSFDVGIDASATVLAASFGAGVSFEEGKRMVVEDGKWVWGQHFINQNLTSTIPDIEVEHADLMSDIIQDVPDWLKVTIGVVNFFTSIFKDEATTFELNETGSNLLIKQNAIPEDIDSLFVTSWSWYGSSPDEKLSDIPKERREVFTSIRKRAEDVYGMEYGIGGFYQFEPYGLQLNDTCLLTIVYHPEEIAHIDETTLGIYSEDKENKKWIYIGGEVNTEENTVTAPINKLSLFTIAPAVPYGAFGLHASPDSISADSISFTTIISDSIFYNNHQPVTDGTLFTVELSHGRIISPDEDVSRPGIQVSSTNGKIEFDARSSHIAGKSRIYAYSINGSASGSTEVIFYDTIPPDPPQIIDASPGNRSVLLKWLANQEEDLAGYKIYFDTDTLPPLEGIHTVYGQPSPIIMDIDTLRNVQGLFNDSTYYFAVSAFDISGNESELSGFVSATPSLCPLPSGISYTNLTHSSITISWIAGQNITNYELIHGPEDFDPDTEGTIATGITEDSYLLIGLQPDTSYDVYIRTVCGDDTFSQWVGPLQFTTISCEALSVPIYENFDLVNTPQLPVCWLVDKSEWAIARTSSVNYYSPPNSLFLESSNLLEYATFISPIINHDLSEVRLRFKATGFSYVVGPFKDYKRNIGLSIGTYDQDIEGSFENYATIVLDDEGWQEYYVYFNDYVGNNERIAISTEGITEMYNIYIDDIIIEQIPLCTEPFPTSLFAYNFTTHSAMITWENYDDSAVWDITWGETGIAPDEGNIIQGVIDNPFLLDGLSHSTTYEYYVRTNCGDDGVSIWAGPHTFKTLYLFETPYFQNFNETLALPPGWSGSFSVVPGVGIDDSNALKSKLCEWGWFPWPLLYCVESEKANTPVFDVSGSDYHRLSFKYRIIDYDEPYVPDEFMLLNLDVSYDYGNTYTTLFSIDQSNHNPSLEFVEVDIAIQNQISNSDHIMIRLAHYNHIGLEEEYAIIVDNFKIVPYCHMPNELFAFNVSNTSAEISWTPGQNESHWDIIYGISGFDPDSEGTLLDNITDKPYFLSGLSPETTYDVYVRAVCEQNVSDWSAPVTLTTGEHDILDNLLLSGVISDGETECFDALQTITVSDFTVEAGGSAELIAGESIHLLPGTTVEHGGYLLARIAAHQDDYCGIPRAIEIAKEPVTLTEEDFVSADFPYEIRKNGFFKLYPNPTDGTFTLELTTAELVQTITVEVHSMLGGQLFTKELPPQRLHSLSLEGQQPGMYIIRVMKGDKVGVERLIKR